MINAQFNEETKLFEPIDPSLPLGVDTVDLGLDEPPENLYCEEKDYEDLL